MTSLIAMRAPPLLGGDMGREVATHVFLLKVLRARHAFEGSRWPC